MPPTATHIKQYKNDMRQQKPTKKKQHFKKKNLRFTKRSEKKIYRNKHHKVLESTRNGIAYNHIHTHTPCIKAILTSHIIS